MDYQTAVKVSAGFGGGMYIGSVCGAVTGGIMALGLKYGAMGPQGMQTAKIVRTFTDGFKAQHQTVICRELTGVDITNPEIYKKLTADLSKPENMAAAKEVLGGREPAQLFAACTSYVRDAAKAADEMVKGSTT